MDRGEILEPVLFFPENATRDVSCRGKSEEKKKKKSILAPLELNIVRSYFERNSHGLAIALNRNLIHIKLGKMCKTI